MRKIYRLTIKNIKSSVNILPRVRIFKNDVNVKLIHMRKRYDRNERYCTNAFYFSL